MLWSDYEKAILALCLWREDRSGGLEGMKAVGCCIRNRVSKWGWSYTKAIEGKNQFSSISVLGDTQTILYPPVNDPLFTQVLSLVEDIYDNSLVDVTMGALYYCSNPSTIPQDGWFAKNILQDPTNHPLIGVFGSQYYYR
jgi:hypothetical protein